MAPARTAGTATRRVDQDHHHQEQQQDSSDDEDLEELFVDPMLGAPLTMYIEKDVEDKDNIALLIKKHGGIVCPGYSAVTYILVDPHKASGQNLWRQYNNKKGKIVLNAEWVDKCVEARELLTYASDWGGCKVTGTEEVADTVPNAPVRHRQFLAEQQRRQEARRREEDEQQHQQQMQQHLPIPVHLFPPPWPHPAMLVGPSMPPPPPIPGMPPPTILLPSLTVQSLLQQHATSQQMQQAHVQTEAQPPPPVPPPPPPAPGPQPEPQPSTSSGPFPFPVYPAASHATDRVLESGPPQTWGESGSIYPTQTRLHPPLRPPALADIQGQAPPQEEETPPQEHPTSMSPHLFLHRPPPENTWNGFDPTAPQDPMGLEYRDNPAWDPYYAACFGPAYLDDPSTHIDTTLPTSGPGVPPVAHLPPAQPPPPATLGLAPTPSPGPMTRGRKRARNATKSTMPIGHLAQNKGPPARSPSPPTRIIKSTYGGNLFTAEDILYLKKYIDYCQEQGLVLSLREICERIAVKAPQHTFYSWRRYCNKHQIRLGGYQMAEREDCPSSEGEQDPELAEIAADNDIRNSLLAAAAAIAAQTQGQEEVPAVAQRMAQEEVAAAQRMAQAEAATQAQAEQQSGMPAMPTESTVLDPMAPILARGRSPTPPRALFRSTTGKGVAFTPEDVNFLIKFMDHRRAQGRLDMVTFWKEVALKAPHHSRASWMKYWRRHKHEWERETLEDPVPQPPEKKMRYSREDDVLIAKFLHTKPDGTSDKVFQNFGRIYPHHPWKGWQEHYRIHKSKIDYLLARLEVGENIDVEGPSG